MRSLSPQLVSALFLLALPPLAIAQRVHSTYLRSPRASTHQAGMSAAGLFSNFKSQISNLRFEFQPRPDAEKSAPASALWRGVQGATPPSAASSKLDVTDEVGRRVSIPQPVRRIVSLAPNLTETIYALGAEDRLVGVTDYCDFPPEAKQKTRVGGAVNPSLEQIVALKPDLVLAQAITMNRRETVDALEALGIAVYAAGSHSVEGILESTRHIADVVGAGEQSAALLKNLRARLDALQRRLAGRSPRRVLFVVWTDPLVSVGRRTFIADALRLAGAESVVETDQDWPRLSLEEVVRRQPEFLIFASSHSEAVRTTVEELSARPGWRGMDAIRNRRIAIVSDAINRPAPRLVEAVEDLARQLHPDAFKEQSENRKEEIENRKSSATRCMSPAPPNDELRSGIPIFSFLFSLFAFEVFL